MLIGAGVIMLGQCRANRQELQGCNPQPFQAYLDYLLGEHVWDLVARSAEGGL